MSFRVDTEGDFIEEYCIEVSSDAVNHRRALNFELQLDVAVVIDIVNSIWVIKREDWFRC